MVLDLKIKHFSSVHGFGAKLEILFIQFKNHSRHKEV